MDDVKFIGLLKCCSWKEINIDYNLKQSTSQGTVQSFTGVLAHYMNQDKLPCRKTSVRKAPL